MNRETHLSALYDWWIEPHDGEEEKRILIDVAYDQPDVRI